jgi:hypothetical protein
VPYYPESTSRRAIVEELFAAFTRGDMQTVLDTYADDVEYESWPASGLGVNFAQAAGVPWLQPRHGKEQVLEHLSSLSDLAISNFEIVAFMEGDNRVAVQVVIDATWTPTGISFRDEEMQYFEFDDSGKIVKTRHYLDTAKHLTAAGCEIPSPTSA